MTNQEEGPIVAGLRKFLVEILAAYREGRARRLSAPSRVLAILEELNRLVAENAAQANDWAADEWAMANDFIEHHRIGLAQIKAGQSITLDELKDRLRKHDHEQEVTKIVAFLDWTALHPPEITDVWNPDNLGFRRLAEAYVTEQEQ